MLSSGSFFSQKHSPHLADLFSFLRSADLFHILNSDNNDGSERLREDYNRNEENRQPVGSDVPADNIPPTDNDRQAVNGNSNIGGQPVLDENRSNQDPPMQWDNPGNGNGEPPMIQDERGNGGMQPDPGEQPSLQDYGRSEGGSGPPHGGR